MNPKTENAATTIIVARSRKYSPVLICKKCLKRCPRGRQIKRELKSELKRRREGGAKPRRLVVTGCFGICPKGAVTIANGTGLQNGEYLLVSFREGVDGALKILAPL